MVDRCNTCGQEIPIHALPYNIKITLEDRTKTNDREWKAFYEYYRGTMKATGKTKEEAIKEILIGILKYEYGVRTLDSV